MCVCVCVKGFEDIFLYHKLKSEICVIWEISHTYVLCWLTWPVFCFSSPRPRVTAPPLLHKHKLHCLPSVSFSPPPPPPSPILIMQLYSLTAGWRAALNQHCPLCRLQWGALFCVKEWRVNTHVWTLSTRALCLSLPLAHPVSPHALPLTPAKFRGYPGLLPHWYAENRHKIANSNSPW